MSLAAPAERRGKRMQRLAGALAFCGLAAGTVVAVRDECPPETGGRGTVRFLTLVRSSRPESPSGPSLTPTLVPQSISPRRMLTRTS